MGDITKCKFCGRLFESSEFSNGACPKCQSAARRNDFPGADVPAPEKKRFVESDGFFDEKEFLSEDKGSFHESSGFHSTK